MANIGNLALQLSVNPSAFISGLQQAQTKLTEFAAATKTAFASIPFLGGPLGGLAGLAGAGGLAASMKAGMDSVAQTAKQADAFGISMRDMAGFQQLAGGKAEEFTHALGKLNAELGAAKAGSSEAQKKFAELGFSADAFAGKNLADSYRVIADQIARLPDVAERAYAAHQLLGKGGTDLVGIVQKGGGVLDYFAQKAQDMGRVTDRVAAESVIQAKRAMDQLNKSVQALGEQLAILAAGPLAKMLRGLALLASFSPAALPFTEEWKKMVLSDEKDKFFADLNAKHPEWKAMDAANLAASKRANDFKEALKKATEAMDMESAGLGKSANQHKLLEAATLASTDAEKKKLAAAQAYAQTLDSRIAGMQKQLELEKEAGRVLEENLSPLERFQGAMNDLSKLEGNELISRMDKMKSAMRLAEGLRDSLGLGNAPGLVTGQEAGSAAAQQTLAQAEARNSFAWADDLKSLLEIANQKDDEKIELLKQWLEKNGQIISAAF